MKAQYCAIIPTTYVTTVEVLQRYSLYGFSMQEKFISKLIEI